MQMISDNNSVTRDWSFLHRNITRCLTKAPSFSFNFSLVDRTTQFIPSFRQRIKFHEHPREQIQEFHEMLHFLRQFKRRSKIHRFLSSLPFRFIVRTSRSVARRSLQFQNATTNYARRTVGKKIIVSCRFSFERPLSFQCAACTCCAFVAHRETQRGILFGGAQHDQTPSNRMQTRP